MVRVGFICEGDIEKMFVETFNFQNYLRKRELKYVGAINAKGNNNLLPYKIVEHDRALKKQNAEKIIILTDSDGKKRVDVEKRIDPQRLGHILVLAVQEIEAWFLSDTETLKDVLQETQFKLKKNPEEFQKPSVRVLPKLIKDNRKLILSKKGIADLFLSKDTIKRKYFFKIENANCNSAKEFLMQLEDISDI